MRVERAKKEEEVADSTGRAQQTLRAEIHRQTKPPSLLTLLPVYL